MPRQITHAIAAPVGVATPPPEESEGDFGETLASSSSSTGAFRAPGSRLQDAERVVSQLKKRNDALNETLDCLLTDPALQRVLFFRGHNAVESELSRFGKKLALWNL